MKFTTQMQMQVQLFLGLVTLCTLSTTVSIGSKLEFPTLQNGTTITPDRASNIRNGKSVNLKPIKIIHEEAVDPLSEEVPKSSIGSLLGVVSDSRVVTEDGDNQEGEEFPTLRCHSCEPPSCAENSHYTCLNAIKCWKSRTRESTGIERVSRGCIQDPAKVVLVCKTRKHRKSSTQGRDASGQEYLHLGMYATECCSDRDYCNDGQFPDLPHPDYSTSQHAYKGDSTGILTDTEAWYIAAIGFIILFLIVIIIGFLVTTRRTHKKRLEAIGNKSDEFYPLNSGSGDDALRVKAAGDSTLKEYMDGSMTSGSGSGLPLLIQRTLAKNIQLKRCIGKGRYGEVWQGIFNCENVAVKILSTLDEASWIRETEIYSTVMLRHENILGFYGSDMISRNSVTQLWVVTNYHKHGSLYDFLNNRILTQVQLLKFTYSIANGLAFLHSEMIGTESRAGIAHRDIKSKNILVSSGENCVLADFGLAVTHKRDTNEINVFPNPKVGTRRYMAPEILDEKMNMKSFDAFKRADMYALGLVFWEMSRRTMTGRGTEFDLPEYQPPFFDIVPSDPSFEDMKKVVCDEAYRPPFPAYLTSELVLSYFVRIIRECWHQNPSVRLSALRVKKSIAIIAHEEFKGVIDAVI